MATADTFHGAKNAFSFFFAYLNTVGQDIGMERAIALDTRMCETLGSAMGKAIKEKAGIEEIDAMGVDALTGGYIDDALGFSSEVIQKSGNRVVYKIGRCPIYEAAQELGMDDATVETICRASAIRFMDTRVKQINPHLSYQLNEFRSSADNFCIEEVKLG